MSHLLLSLAVGVGLIVLANLGLVRFALECKAGRRRGGPDHGGSVRALWHHSLAGRRCIRDPSGIYLLASLACGMLLGARAGDRGLHWGRRPSPGFSFSWR